MAGSCQHVGIEEVAPEPAVQPTPLEFIGQVGLHDLRRLSFTRMNEIGSAGERREQDDAPRPHGVGAWLPLRASFSTRPRMATPSRIFSGVSVTKDRRSARGSGLAA